MPDSVRRPSLSHWGAFTSVVEDGRLVACEPFAHDSAPSPLIAGMPAMVYSPLRIARPAVRRGWLANRGSPERRGQDDYVEVSWETALDLVHGELARVRAEHGPTGIFGGSYGWSSAGRLHHARTLTHRFLNTGGGCVNQAGNYSWGAAQFLLPHVIGTFAPVTGRVTDWNSVARHTRVFLAFGGLPLRNTQITSGGAGDHTTPGWLAEAVRHGVRFVMVTPSRADLPEGVDAEWIPIRPNTDAAMMLGMAHTLLTTQRHDADFLARYCTGADAYADYVRGVSDGVPKTAEWAQAICGVPAQTIRELALRAASQRSMISCAWSLQRGHHGEQPYWNSIALACVIGQIGLPGGGFGFGHASLNGVGNPRADLPTVEMTAGRNPANCSIPVARLTDMLEKPGEAYAFNGKQAIYPDIRMVYWAGGNPFHHHQDLNRLARAWSRPETIVVHESWWTPTARRADIVLPATTTLERNDVGGSSRDRYILAMHQAIAPVESARNDFDIYRELAERGGFEAAFTEGRTEMQWLQRIYGNLREACQGRGHALPDFDAFWEAGHVRLPAPDSDFILFESFRDDPVAHPLQTPSGKIELYSERIATFEYADCPPHPCWLAPDEWLGAARAEHYPLHLISHQPADRLHSQLDPAPQSQGNKIQSREAVRLHPNDAAKRGIAPGDAVRIFNDRGSCLAGAVCDANLVEGVISMATGAWFDPQDGTLERHGNPNVLTFDRGTSQLAQASSALSALVDVERWVGPLPAMRAFDLPAIARQ